MSQHKSIVFVIDAESRAVVTASLESGGAGAAKLVDSPEACIEALVQEQKSILVIDMAAGSEQVNQILTASKTHFKVETRPILILVSELTDSALATASEYNVSQIHAGDIEKESVEVCIKQLVNELNSTDSIRDVLIKVATARSRGDWSIATPLLEREHEKNPNDERLSLELAENYIHERNWSGAEKLLEPYLSTTPPMIRALNLKARCLMNEGQFDAAATIMEKAKLLNPHNVERLIEFGHVLISSDRIDDARQQFEEAGALDNENVEASRGVGQCMLMQGEVNEALDFLKSISGPRELASVFNSAAVMSIHNGHFDQGMTLYKKAFKVVGTDDKIAARLLFNMGLGYKKNDDLVKALDCFTKAADLDPEYDKAGHHKQATEKLMKNLKPQLATTKGQDIVTPQVQYKDTDTFDRASEFDEEEFGAPAGPASGH